MHFPLGIQRLMSNHDNTRGTKLTILIYQSYNACSSFLGLCHFFHRVMMILSPFVQQIATEVYTHRELSQYIA